MRQTLEEEEKKKNDALHTFLGTLTVATMVFNCYQITYQSIAECTNERVRGLQSHKYDARIPT